MLRYCPKHDLYRAGPPRKCSVCIYEEMVARHEAQRKEALLRRRRAQNAKKRGAQTNGPQRKSKGKQGADVYWAVAAQRLEESWYE